MSHYPLTSIRLLYSDWLVELGKGRHSASVASTEFIATVQKENEGFFALAYKGAKLIGFMYSKVVPKPYGADYSFAMVDHVYVSERYRGAKVLKDLCSQTMLWATDKNLKAIHGMTPRPKAYQRLGFKPVGTYLSMEIN